MSEGNGLNSGIPNADENVLDDLMQNNVQFDEDEKPKTVSFNQESTLSTRILQILLHCQVEKLKKIC